METLFLWLHLFFGLFLSGIRAQSAHHHRQHASGQSPQPAQSHREHRAPAGERGKVHTVKVSCHADSLEVVIQADLFGVGVPVDSDELRLGVEDNDNKCRPTAFSGDQYRMVVGFVDCGTKHWMTKDSLVYTNLLIYSPVESPYGLIRLDEAVVPIECHYERKYSLSVSSLTPAWIPFVSTQAAVEALKFDLAIMTGDWLYKRSSNVFHLGESISVEASVRVGHHVGLRVFMSNCVATLSPDVHSAPRYVFIENGCLTDSQVSRSRSHFLPRTQDHKLRLVIDAFRFRHADKGGLYVTCQLNAVPVNYAEASYKACTFANGRWRSADSNDYSCRHCQGRAGQSLMLEHEARVGPVLVLPAKYKSGALPADERKLSRPVPYGSQWRSGITDRTVKLEKGQVPRPTPEAVEEDEDEEDHSETVFNDLEMEMLRSLPSAPDLLEEDDELDMEINEVEKAPFPVPTPTAAMLEETDLNDVKKGPRPELENDDKELDNEDLHDISPTSQVKLGVTSVTVEFNFSDPNVPKR